MAVSSSSSYAIYHFLHQYQLVMVEDILIYVPPAGCKRRDMSRVLNVIPSDPDLFSRIFEEVAYIKSEDQPIRGVITYESDIECNKSREKYKLKRTLHVCYGKLKWRKIC